MQQISYEELKAIAKRVAKSISDNHPDYELVAVARGGLTFAQLVAYNLAKPLSFFVPKDRILLRSWVSCVPEAHLIFLEDVIAEGRTFRIIDDYAAHNFLPSWEMIPVVLDASAPLDIQDRVNIYGMKTSDWMVFPHEDFDLTVEGDRGMFREGTSANAKPAI